MTQVVTADTAMLSTPWRKAGVVVEGLMTAEEAIEQAGLDWQVELHPAGYQDAAGSWVPIPSRFANVRSDTKAALGIVGGDYQTLANRESFAFTTPLATLGAAYDSAGYYGQGQHVFLTMKLERDALEEDPHDVYLFVRTSHDGSKSIQAIVTPVRRRCTNQDGLITRTAEARWTVRHNTTMEARLAEAQESLKKTFKYIESFEEMARRLMTIELETEQFQKMLEEALPKTKRQQKLVDAVVGIRENSLLLDDIRPTAWGALQSFTEWTDHRRPFRRPETRLKAITDGWAAQVRNDLAQRMLRRS